MDKNKLNAKDFINIGIFTVIYFVMFFVAGIMGYIPIFAVVIPFMLGILGGVPFMLFFCCQASKEVASGRFFRWKRREVMELCQYIGHRKLNFFMLPE